MADAEPLAISGAGTEFFRGLLHYRHIKPVTEREFLLMNRYDDVILISLGRSPTQFNVAGRFRHVLEQASVHGSALIAADSDEPFRSTAGHDFAIWGPTVACRESRFRLRDDPGCPFVVPMSAGRDRFFSGIFSGLDRVATNRPSFITVSGWGGDVQAGLAKFPPGCSASGFNGRLPINALFAVAGEGPDQFNANAYRFLVLADHSVFINQMLLEPNTDNLELAWRVIDYLQGPGKARMRCVFFENGQLIDHFDDLSREYGKQQPVPIPHIDRNRLQAMVADLGNRALDRIEQNDILNKILDRGFGVPNIVRFLIVVGAILGSFFVLRRLWGSREPSDVPPPLPVAVASTGPPGVFDRRQKELLRRNNILEPVRDLVREFFESIGIPHEGMKRPPKVVIADVVRKPESLRAAIQDFWAIAFGPPRVLTVERWRELEPFFERVRQAHADGKWRFVMAESQAGSEA